jgi:hypothetical protein
MSQPQAKLINIPSILLFINIFLIQTVFALRRLLLWVTRSIERVFSFPLSLMLLILAATHETLLRMYDKKTTTMKYNEMEHMFWDDGGANITIDADFKTLTQRACLSQTPETAMKQVRPSSSRLSAPEEASKLNKLVMIPKRTPNVLIQTKRYLETLNTYTSSTKPESDIELLSYS